MDLKKYNFSNAAQQADAQLALVDALTSMAMPSRGNLLVAHHTVSGVLLFSVGAFTSSGKDFVKLLHHSLDGAIAAMELGLTDDIGNGESRLSRQILIARRWMTSAREDLSA